VNIISIDPGSKSTGVYLSFKDVSYSISIKPEKKRYCDMYQQLNDLLIEQEIDVAFIEDYAYGNTLPGKRTLSEFVGIIKLCLEWNNIPWIAVPIQTWKSYCMKGLPKLKNKKYIDMVNKEYQGGINMLKTADECDAYMIYRCMRKIISGIWKSNTAVKLKNEFDKIVNGVIDE
jgi:Holliday junction resolvasome RuvABC endonuclease subunit